MADGNRTVQPIVDAAVSASGNATGIIRCGWCGLPPVPGDPMLEGSGDLCTACSELLRGTNWKSLLA